HPAAAPGEHEGVAAGGGVGREAEVNRDIPARGSGAAEGRAGLPVRRHVAAARCPGRARGGGGRARGEQRALHGAGEGGGGAGAVGRDGGAGEGGGQRVAGPIRGPGADGDRVTSVRREGSSRSKDYGRRISPVEGTVDVRQPAGAIVVRVSAKRHRTVDVAGI